MKETRLLLLVAVFAISSMSPVNAEMTSEVDVEELSNWELHIGASAKIGTLGYGVEVSVPVIQDKLNVRAGFNTFSYDYEEKEGDTDLTYKGDLSLQSFPVLIDWHPFNGGFRLSTGLIINNNEITASAECTTTTCEFGNEQINKDILGTTRLAVDLGGTQPYLGLGFGNAVSSDDRLSFVFDLGVVFQDVAVSLTTSDACQANAQCKDEAQREEAELQDDVKDFDMYPVIAFGLSYKFK